MENSEKLENGLSRSLSKALRKQIYEQSLEFIPIYDDTKVFTVKFEKLSESKIEKRKDHNFLVQQQRETAPSISGFRNCEERKLKLKSDGDNDKNLLPYLTSYEIFTPFCNCKISAFEFRICTPTSSVFSTSPIIPILSFRSGQKDIKITMSNKKYIICCVDSKCKSKKIVLKRLFLQIVPTKDFTKLALMEIWIDFYQKNKTKNWIHAQEKLDTNLNFNQFRKFNVSCLLCKTKMTPFFFNVAHDNPWKLGAKRYLKKRKEEKKQTREQEQEEEQEEERKEQKEREEQEEDTTKNFDVNQPTNLYLLCAFCNLTQQTDTLLKFLQSKNKITITKREFLIRRYSIFYVSETITQSIFQSCLLNCKSAICGFFNLNKCKDFINTSFCRFFKKLYYLLPLSCVYYFSRFYFRDVVAKEEELDTRFISRNIENIAQSDAKWNLWVKTWIGS